MGGEIDIRPLYREDLSGGAVRDDESSRTKTGGANRDGVVGHDDVRDAAKAEGSNSGKDRCVTGRLA